MAISPPFHPRPPSTHHSIHPPLHLPTIPSTHHSIYPPPPPHVSVHHRGEIWLHSQIHHHGQAQDICWDHLDSMSPCIMLLHGPSHHAMGHHVMEPA